MTEKLALTDRKLKSLKPAKQRYEIMDSVIPGFGVRVGSKGNPTFILVGRFAGSKNPTRRAVGTYGELTLEEARARARQWIALNAKGVDPKVEIERGRQAELRKQAETFGSVVEAYIKHIARHRTARMAENTIRRELLSQWSSRPITEITRADVIRVIEGVADHAPYTAHLVLGYVRAIFNWAINRGTYGLDVSPTDRLKPSALIAPKEPRQRVLHDDELVALWHATEQLKYPFGPLYQVLLLTGCRLREIAGAQWQEIDLSKGLLTVPKERFKSNSTHLVPLSADALSVIKSLPRFAGGDCLFTTTAGRRPVGDFSHAKTRTDAFMAKELGSAPPHWVVHDIRRTVRTRLSALRVPDMVAEMVIGHGKKGLARVYDQHSYESEMREALELWAARLRSIVEPPPENVVELKTRA